MTRVDDAPRTLGSYQLLERLGEGSFATVYKACRTDAPERLVALKVALPGTERELLAAEQRIHDAIDHPAVVQVHEAVLAQHPPYLVLEYCSGGNLRQLLEREGPLPHGVAFDLIAQLLDCLETAHEQGIVHRDLKPENLLLDAQGKLKVADFGLGQISFDQRSMLLSMRSQAGGVVGTFDYMAPEQKQGEGDHRVDLYAVGVIVFELLTGRRPDRNDALDAHLTDEQYELWSKLYQGLCTPVSRRVEHAWMVRERLERWQEQRQAQEQATRVRRTRTAPPQRKPDWSERLGWFYACVVAVIVVGAISWTRSETPSAKRRAARVYPVVDQLPAIKTEALERADDASLARLRLEPGVQGLSLAGTDVTDAGLRHLARLKLRALSLAGCKGITDRALPHLARLPLERLNLTGTLVTDEGLAELTRRGGAARLEVLDLSGTRLRGPGLRNLAPLRKLRILRLRGCSQIQATLAIGALRDELKGLQSLSLSQWRGLSLMTLAGLARDKPLYELDLRAHPGVADEVIRAMRSAAPRCRIYW